MPGPLHAVFVKLSESVSNFLIKSNIHSRLLETSLTHLLHSAQSKRARYLDVVFAWMQVGTCADFCHHFLTWVSIACSLQLAKCRVVNLRVGFD